MGALPQIKMVGSGPPFFVREQRYGRGSRRLVREQPEAIDRAAMAAAGGELSHTSEGLAAVVEALVRPSLADMGFEIVRILLMSGGQRQKLQIMAERADGSLSIDDCAEISRTVSALLEVEDPIAGAYDLEVSSPGIDRPLTRLKDFARYSGFEARVELRLGQDGQRRFRGRLEGLDGADILLRDGEGRDWRLPFADLARAKLILTDDLLESHAAAASEQAPAGEA